MGYLTGCGTLFFDKMPLVNFQPIFYLILFFVSLGVNYFSGMKIVIDVSALPIALIGTILVFVADRLWFYSFQQTGAVHIVNTAAVLLPVLGVASTYFIAKVMQRVAPENALAVAPTLTTNQIVGMLVIMVGVYVFNR